MSGALKSSPWIEAMATDGFIIFCGRGPQGEGFIIISTDPPRVAGLRKIPDSWGSWMSGPLIEADVRSKLMEAGLSTSDIDAKLEWARQWATTITRPAGSEPVLWWPNPDDWKPSDSR